ncbi:MAG TPA: hypothetical protein VJ717_10445 [Gemmatimonadaceae bacterium]|nr:hypothetical protein [Gemmatimonadaceae bacterium]
MRHNSILRSGLVAVAFALASNAVGAQATTSNPSASSAWGGPHTIEGYYTHYRLDTSGDDRLGMHGLGGRLMWNGSLRFAGLESLPSRTAIGVFAEYAPSQDRGFSIVHAGAQGDVRLASSPLFGRLTPIASLAAGALWTDVQDASRAIATGFPLGTRRTTTLAITPALGLRLGLWRELGLRADVRDVMTFRHRTLNNWQFATGLSLAF